MLAEELQSILKQNEVQLVRRSVVSLLSGTIEIAKKQGRTGSASGINVKLRPLFETIQPASNKLVNAEDTGSLNLKSASATDVEKANDDVKRFSILEELERIACIQLDGAQTFAAANLPTLLIECMSLLCRRDLDCDSISRMSSPSDLNSCDNYAQPDNIIMEDEDEIYDDYQLTDDEKDSHSNTQEAEMLAASDEDWSDDEPQQLASKNKKRYRRSDVVASRLRALCCALVGHKTVMLSLIRGPEFGLVKVFALVTWSLNQKISSAGKDSEIVEFSLSAGLAVLKAMSSEELVLPVVEFMCEHQLLRSLVRIMIETCKAKFASAELLDKMSRSLLEVVRIIICLLRCSCRESSILLENFETCGGFELFHVLVCTFPPRVEEILPEIVNLLCFGTGFKEAEAEAAAIGAIHPIYRVRNVRAFSVVSHLICQLCLSEYMAPSPAAVESVLNKYLDEKLSYSQVSVPSIADSLTYAWSIIKRTDGVEARTQQNEPKKGSLPPEGLQQEHRIKSYDELRLPLLHCVLNIYSSNPSNFGILDKKYGVMSSLVLSLGSRTSSVSDEFLFMVIKLVELVAMGMDYKPTHVLKSLCMISLPQIVTRAYMDQSGPAPEHEQNQEYKVRRQSLCLDESARYYRKQRSFSGESMSQTCFIMEVLCNTLTKLVKSDDEYKDALRNCGLLSYAIFPFIKLTAESSYKSVLFDMLPMWCSLLCEMIESNATNQTELRQACMHHTLYKLLRYSATVNMHNNLENVLFQPNSVLSVLLRLASDDSPSLGQDVAALLELLQKQDFSLQFKQNLLETLIEMMRRNYRVKDIWREKSGYETASALLLSLDSKLNEIELSGEEKLKECIILVKSVFTAFSVSMSGSHLSNRLYMRTNQQYESIASTCKLIGLFGTKYDIQLVDMISNCATETNDLDWLESGSETSSVYTIKLQNPDPFAILVDEIDSLSGQGLDRLLKVFLVMFGRNNKERIVNCDLFLSNDIFSTNNDLILTKSDLNRRSTHDMTVILLQKLEHMLVDEESTLR